MASEDEYVSGSFEAIQYTYYKDYREGQGLMLPYKTLYITNESKTTILVDSYELNTEIDPSMFKFKDDL